jgi:DNA helicase-2/ATP-dependent DNA helicase PcrA
MMASILDGLNDKQRQAVTSDSSVTIVLAGPGSGKTRVLTHRVAWLVRQKGVKPWEILAVTFTNKAANEVKERLARLLSPAQAEKVTARTFHSFGARLLRYEMAHLAPLLPDNMFTAIDYEQHGARVTPLCWPKRTSVRHASQFPHFVVE